MNTRWVYWCALLLLSQPLGASELDDALGGFDEPVKAIQNNELDDVLDGFDEPNVTLPTVVKAEPESSFPINGYLSFSSSYNYANPALNADGIDYQGFSKAKFAANIFSDFKINEQWQAHLEFQVFTDVIYAINGRDQYNDDTLSTYESEIKFNEAYILGSLTDNIDLKIGRQIEVWGKSDSIRVTDIINPLNNREPGIVDIEELRVPVLMSKLSYYYQDWAFRLLAIHEQKNPLEAAIDSEFFPTSALPFPPNFIFPDVDEGAVSFSDTTFALVADGRFSGWDLSFYAAQVSDNRWHFENNKTERQYGLVDMAGIASNVVVNGILLKAEIAYFDKLAYNTTTDLKSRLDSLVGIEYMGFSDWVLAAEYAQRSINNYEAQMINAPDMVKEVSTQLALRASYSFDHDNATVSLLNTQFGNNGEEGGFNRLWLDYALDDQFDLSVGIIDYLSGTNIILDAISDNDRLFMSVRYQF